MKKKKEKWEKFLDTSHEVLVDYRLSYYGDVEELSKAESSSRDTGLYEVYDANQAPYEMIMEYYHRGGSSIKEREIIDLYYEDGLTYAQMAKKLGISLSTVKSRFYRIRKKIRGF